MAEVYVFLQKFFTEYPQYAHLDFFLAGESYAGHYIPVLSSIILEGNEAIASGNAPEGTISISLVGLCKLLTSIS